MENYLAVKINELQLHATTWMYLTNMTLMETSQEQILHTVWLHVYKAEKQEKLIYIV